MTEIPIPPRARLTFYGLTEGDFIDLWLATDGHCPMCERRFTKLRPACVDHDHVTFTVRGLLCSSCNLELGYKHDDWGWFQRTADYLNVPTADEVFDNPRIIRDAPEVLK